MNGAGDACILLPGDVRLGTTGAEIGPVIVIAGALVALGVVVLLFALLLRRRKEDKGPHRVLAATLVLLALAGLGQMAPSRAEAAGGCDLLGWSMTSSAYSQGQTVLVGGTPVDIVAYKLKNISNVPIQIQFRTDTTLDPNSISSFVELVGNCAKCSVQQVYQDHIGSPNLGPIFKVLPGDSIDVTFTAATFANITNDKQNKSATFDLVALARQI